MKLSKNSLNRFSTTERRFSKIKQNFADFIDAAAHLSTDRSPIPGILFERLEDGHACEVRYRNATVRFTLTYYLDAKDDVAGLVICTLLDPVLDDKLIELGLFSFTFGAVTDIQTSDGQDNVELLEMAPEIVLEFLRLAFSRGAA